MEAESQTKLDHSSLADMGIKILVDAMTEAETNSTKTTSTPLRKEDLPVENSSILAETDTSLDDNSVGYNADTSNAMADCTTFESPAKVGCNYLNATPLTPTANLKMLVAAASSALDRENLEKAGEVLQQNSDKDDCQSRKTKSLAILCKKFLQVANDEIGAGKEFSLEMMSTSLGINRRRIYDIINVLEALEMISKQSKNWYMWHGQCNLVTTLAKLKVQQMLLLLLSLLLLLL
jgi:transcription factor E2F7/8